MIDLDALQSYLKGLGPSVTLRPTDAKLPPELQALLRATPGGALALKIAPGGVVRAGNDLTIKGTTSAKWVVEGLKDVTVTVSAVTVTLSNAPAGPPARSVAAGTLSLGGANVPVSVASRTPASAGWEIRLVSAAGGLTASKLLGLGGTSPLPFPVPPGLAVLEDTVSVAASAFSLRFAPVAGSSAALAFSLSSNAAWEPVPGVLRFSGLDLGAEVVRSAASSMVSVTLVGRLDINSVKVDVGVAMSLGDNWSGFVRPSAGSSWPTLLDFAAWVGGADLRGKTQGGVSGVGLDPAAFNLQLTGVDLDFNWRTKVLDSLRVASVVTVAGLPLDLLVTLPDLMVTGGLHDGKPVPVSQVLQACGLPAAGTPAGMSVARASFSAALKKNAYMVSAKLDRAWSAGPVSLDEVSLRIGYANRAFSGAFTAQFALTDAARLEISAEYEEAAGWTFEGGTQAGTDLKMGDLIAKLASSFGIASVPEPVASLVLRDLSVRYSTLSGAFDFACEGEFTVNDTLVRAIVTISVVRTENAPKAGAVAGTKGYSATFAGTLISGGLRFNLAFNTKDTGSRVFIATYVEETAGASSLQSLVNTISPGAAADIPGDFDIDVRQVKFAALRTPPTPPATAATTLWAFGVGLSASLSLSEIPGLGSVIGDKSLALKDLNLLYRSGAFTADQTTSVNALLPAGVQPLPPPPAAGTTTNPPGGGLSFSGRVAFGTMSIPFGLGASAGAAKTSPSPIGGTGTTPSSSGTTRTAPARPDPVQWVNVNKTFGIFRFDRVGAQYQDGTFSLVLDAGVALGPVSFSVIGLSVGSRIDRFEPKFDLTGLSLSFVRPPITLGGAFMRVKEEDHNSFYGMVMAQLPMFGFSVLGGWTPSYKDKAGKDHPTSFFLFANINVPLGGPPYFYVTGLAGGFGIHRTLKLPNVETLPSYPLLPHNAPAMGGNPADTVKAVLPQLESIFKESPGEYWFALGIQFTSFEMVNAFALLTVAFGVDLQIGLLGTCSMSFPPVEPYPVAYIEVYLMASFSTKTGLLAVEGCLSPASFIYAGLVKISGGFAFYIWVLGPNKGDFVVSMGGYAPGFKKPDHYPNVPRLQLSAGLGPFQILGQAYFALTPSMFMAGLRMQATWESGPIRAWIDAGIDFLISWAPFFYNARVYIQIGVSANLELFSINVQIGAELEIWGPEFGGRAHIDLDVVEFTISFGAERRPPPPLGWAGFSQKFLPKSTAGQAAKGTAPQAMLLDASPADPTNDNVVKAAVMAGFLKDLGGNRWVVDSDGFSIETNSAVPANVASLNGIVLPNAIADYPKFTLAPRMAAPPMDPARPLAWNPDVNVGPMGKRGVKSSVAILLRLDALGENDPAESRVTLTPLVSNAPNAMWGVDKSDDPDRSPNDAPHMELALTGFRISPIPWKPTVVRDVPLFSLLFQTGFRTGFGFQKATPDPKHTVTSKASDTLAIQVDGKSLPPNTGYVLSSLTEPSVRSARKSLLDDLADAGLGTLRGGDARLDVLGKDKALADWPRVELVGA